MADGGGDFPLGKLVSFFVVLGLTVLPVMSCGPLEFTGHEILRNKPPDFDGLTEGLGKSLGGIGKGLGGENAGKGTVETTSSNKPDRDTLFPPSQNWMWFLYIAIFLAAVVSFFIPSGIRARAAVGAFGAVALFVFLSRFQDALMADQESDASGLSVFDWDTGAYLAMIGFALMIFDGLRTRTAGTSRVVD